MPEHGTPSWLKVQSTPADKAWKYSWVRPEGVAASKLSRIEVTGMAVNTGRGTGRSKIPVAKCLSHGDNNDWGGCRLVTKKWVHLLLLLTVSGLFVLGLSRPFSVIAADTMEVRKDENKTTYVIDSKDDGKSEEDKKKAWDMLNNMNLIIDKRGARSGQGQNSNR